MRIGQVTQTIYVFLFAVIHQSDILGTVLLTGAQVLLELPTNGNVLGGLVAGTWLTKWGGRNPTGHGSAANTQRSFIYPDAGV